MGRLDPLVQTQKVVDVPSAENVVGRGDRQEGGERFLLGVVELDRRRENVACHGRVEPPELLGLLLHLSQQQTVTRFPHVLALDDEVLFISREPEVDATVATGLERLETNTFVGLKEVPRQVFEVDGREGVKAVVRHGVPGITAAERPRPVSEVHCSASVVGCLTRVREGERGRVSPGNRAGPSKARPNLTHTADIAMRSDGSSHDLCSRSQRAGLHGNFRRSP